jgi:hypothetical protein
VGEISVEKETVEREKETATSLHAFSLVLSLSLFLSPSLLSSLLRLFFLPSLEAAVTDFKLYAYYSVDSSPLACAS